ncbi:MAG: RNA polymerase factor sigma-32 [SAR116 cluster bacterium]|nr:RNA polymerase factor sigma-32 [SAR116 cluster bacterium]
MTNDIVDYDKKFLNFSMRQSLISKEDEVDFIKNWQLHKDDKSINKIVSSHLRLVISLANKFKNYGLPINELIQEGNVGLMQAVDKFDLNRDVRFSTYASWWIKASMQTFILKNWSIVRIGTTAAQKSLFFKLKTIMSRIEKENNTSFNDYHQKKLAEDIGVKFKDIEDMKGRLAGSDQSLNATFSDNSELEVQDLLVDERASPEQNAILTKDTKTISNLINEALNKLPEREKKIIGARQLSENTVTLQELGKDLGISKERVRQLENRALNKLKLSLQKKVNKNDYLLTS